MQEILEMLEEASHEAVALLVFFQVFTVSAIILHFSTRLNLILWLSAIFLLYSFAGPAFCLKWILVISSLIWNFFYTVFTHPYLVAMSILMYGAYRLYCVYERRQTELKCREMEEEVTLDVKDIQRRLSVIDKQNDDMSAVLDEVVKILMEKKSQNSTEKDDKEDWMTDMT